METRNPFGNSFIIIGGTGTEQKIIGIEIAKCRIIRGTKSYSLYQSYEYVLSEDLREAGSRSLNILMSTKGKKR